MLFELSNATIFYTKLRTRKYVKGYCDIIHRKKPNRNLLDTSLDALKTVSKKGSS